MNLGIKKKWGMNVILMQWYSIAWEKIIKGKGRSRCESKELK